MPYITLGDLAVTLGFHRRNLDRWPVSCLPREVMTRCYRYEDVNSWLAEPGRVHGFAVPPTIERILSGRIKLVRRREAERMLVEALGIKDPVSYVAYRIQTGEIKAIRLRSRSWLVALDSVELMIRDRRRDPEGFSAKEVQQICGIGTSQTKRGERSSSTLRRLHEAGVIEIFRDGNRIRVRRHSFVMLVQRLLGGIKHPIDAEDWIDDRLRSSEPLLSAAHACDRLGILESQLYKLIADGEVNAIQSPGGGKWLVPPEGIEAYKQRASPLTREEIAKVFGTTLRSVREWLRDGLLTCPLHREEPGCSFYRWCLVAYVKECAGNGVSAVSWVHNALSPQGRKMVSEHAIITGKILTAKQLNSGVVSGRIPSITLPNGRKIFLSGAVLKEAKRYGRKK